MSSADDPSSTSGHADARSELNPLEGGRWRPVRPEELLRRPTGPVPEVGEEMPSAPQSPKVTLQRRQELEHHLKSRPADREGYLELARIYRAEERPVDARRILQQALEIFPDDETLLWEHEEAALARSRQQLREVMELASRLDTPETDRELERSQSDWACRRMEVCQARLKRDPSLKHLHVTLAEAMYDAGKYREALQELEPVLEHDDYSAAAHLIRGRCLLELGEELPAMAALRAASLRRSVVAPLPTKVVALRLLCETAERLGLLLTLSQYREHLQHAEQDLAKRHAAAKG